MDPVLIGHCNFGSCCSCIANY